MGPSIHDEGKDGSAAPAEQYKPLVQEFSEARNLHCKATTNEERTKAVPRVEKHLPRLLELAERNADDSIALETLAQVVMQEIWLVKAHRCCDCGKT